ncbi:MAG: nicotinate (nicotinamide) nucleotide adenylyltransferase [Verrucomicrobiota bacterium]|nr:nicotinate (nicotinamide) nucleotide adenylyltransferase [Verrucomicrobiota bacterium]
MLAGKPSRIGLYGGSFDPVHLGHLLVAQSAYEELRLERVFLIPASQNPFKPDRKLAAGSTRLLLLRLALAGITWAEVDSQELQRGGLSYSIDTVRSYRARFPEAELFYLVGADHVEQLNKWKEAEELAKLVEFLIIPRPGETAGRPPAPFRSHLLKGFPLRLSSSEVRERIAQNLPIDLFCGSLVAEAIRNNRLYFPQE